MGSYGRSISSFTNMGSGHRNTHIPDCGTRTVSYAILFPTVNSSQLSMEQNIQYTQSDSKRHIDYRGYSSTCVPLSRQDSLL